MRHVMVLNAKGGCGKSTLATNIAVFFARDGHQVCIADYDPQRSSLDWLAQRPADLPAISGVPAYEDGLRSVARATDILVIDAPARVHGTELNELVRRAETIVIPVLPSTIDIKACAHFMAELLEIGKVSRKQARLAVVANRVREYTLIYEELDQYLIQAQGAVPRLFARSAELRACLCARHGCSGAAGVSCVARLEAVGTDRRVARQQEKPALKFSGAVERRTPAPSKTRANTGVQIAYASATPSSSRRRRLSTRRDSPRKDHEDSEKRSRASARLISGGWGRPPMRATRCRYEVRLSSVPSVTL